MDGLSVAASVAGLVQLTAKVVDCISATADASRVARNMLAEVNALHALFDRLQHFILNFEDTIDDQRSMINVHQLVAILTGCVCAFSELDKILENLHTDRVTGLRSLWISAKWALKDQDLHRILGYLQNHKSSLALMLTIITWFVTASY
jgi:hypothetical protein